MNVIIGCETSGVVREAFRARGHNAISVDLLPAQDGSPHHVQGDLLEVLKGRLGSSVTQPDLLIAHPSCTYLCSSGLHWNSRVPGRDQKTLDALDFVRAIMALPIAKIVVENPRGRIGTAIRKADQKIQPYQFGDDASKETHLWLKGVSPLVIPDPRSWVTPRLVVTAKGGVVKRWANQTDSGQNRLGPSANRWQLRSRTYPGIAKAMAEQWG